MSGHFVAMTVNCESWRGGMGLCCCRGDEQIKTDEPIVMTSFRLFDRAFFFFELFDHLKTCDPQLYISLHCLCYDESRAISDQAYVSINLLSSQKK